MAVTSLRSDVFRAMVQRVIDEAEGGDVNYAEIVQLCLIAGPDLSKGVGDLVDLDYVGKQIAAQNLRWLNQPLNQEEAIAVLSGDRYRDARLAVLESHALIVNRDAPGLVRAIVDLESVYQVSLGIGFGLFHDDLLEWIVSALLELTVEWARYDEEYGYQSVRRLWADICPRADSPATIAIERMIANDRLPQSVVYFLLQEQLAVLKSTASRPVIALRQFILGEEYEERGRRVRDDGDCARQEQDQEVAVA